MHVAIYARYSSDAQSEHSIEDQTRTCRAWAERQGWQVVEVYADYAISGATAARPGFQQMVADAKSGRFQAVLAEALDRFSRDLEHIAKFHKEMTFAGVSLSTVAEGAITQMHIGFGGTMSALFLQNLAQKTHRGLEGRVRAGGSGGGLSFGYRVRKGFRPDGTPIAGELEIDDEQAAIIRRIFRDYADGQSPRSIARGLNAEGVSGPRGGSWTASLLLGGAARETGLLRNQLYVGLRVWNRQRYLKDPATGKRVARPNPREAWITTSVPDLALLDAETWGRTQRRLIAGRPDALDEPNATDAKGSGNTGTRLAAARRPRWPLAGLVRCGVCSGPMSVIGAQGRLGCANHVERGTCDNKRTVLRDALLGRVMIGLKERLLAPELVEEFVRTYVAEINAANRERGGRRFGLQEEQGTLARQVRNLLDLIKEGHGSAAMVGELREVERKQELLQARLAEAETPEPIPTLHPSLPALYRRRVETLEEALADPVTAIAAAEALRSLIDAILVHPGQRRGEVFVTLRGDLAAFLHLAEVDDGVEDRVAVNAKTADFPGEISRLRVVMPSWDAGTGFEPVTFRL